MHNDTMRKPLFNGIFGYLVQERKKSFKYYDDGQFNKSDSYSIE